MEKAIKALRSRKMGLKRPCRKYNVPRTNLQRHYKTSMDSKIIAPKGLGSGNSVFDAELEVELVAHI